MKCLDDCNTYRLDVFSEKTIPGLYGYLAKNPGDILPLLHFYEMREDGTKIDGVTNEEVIRVLIHRLTYLNEVWKEGAFCCQENDEAINHLEKALHALERRTRNREARKVEGKLIP